MGEALWIVTKQAIKMYADAVENSDPLFTSDECSRESGYEQPIAPASFCAQYQMFLDPDAEAVRGLVHTKQKMSFFIPIMAGDYIYARSQTVESEDAKGRSLRTYVTEFVNQRDEVVCRGEMTNLLPSKK